MAGKTVIEVSVTVVPVTVMVAELVNVPDVAVTVAAPAATPVTTPAALTVAVFGSDVLHAAEEVKSLEEPSEYDPSAWRLTVVAATIDEAFGLTESPLSEAGTVCPPEPEPDCPPELDCPLEPDWPLELNWPLAPLQPARNTHNERVQILRCTSSSA